MRKLLFIIAVLLSSIGMFAQPRSEQQAKQIASEFFNKKPQQKTPMLSVVPQQKVSQTINKKMARGKASPAQHSACYIINDEANNRFVIVSSDERMYQILGYSDNGCFDAEKAPVVLLEMILFYNRQYSLLDENVVVSSNEANLIGNQESTAIQPMITSLWGQSEPFNAFCPYDKSYSFDTLSVTGCIATAMAQVINYWKYPKTKCSGGKYQYYNSYYSGLQKISFDYDNYEINWNNLVDSYSDATEEQKTEVAKLMFACGVSVAMGYSAEGSGTKDYNIPYALKHYFGYNPNIVYRNRDFYTAKEWKAMIMEELNSGRPIIYSGFNEEHSGGHAFILDGCDENGLFHYNFGEPLLDLYDNAIGGGYFQLDAIRPTFLGLEIGNFSYYQSMVCNISPEVVGKQEDTFYSEIFALVPQSNYSSNVSFAIQAKCYSSDTNDNYMTRDVFSGEIGIGLFDTDFNFIATMYKESFTGKSNKAYEKLNLDEYITLDTSAMEDGTEYIVAPYAKSDNASNPTIIRTHMLPTWYSEEYKNNAYVYYQAYNYSFFGLLLIPVSIDKFEEDLGVKGDANNDGDVDVADIVYIVNYIMEKPANDFNFANADMDEDGSIDVADITLVVNKIMSAETTSPVVPNDISHQEMKITATNNSNYLMNLPNAEQYVSSQFDVIVPVGMEINDIVLKGDQPDNHQITYRKIDTNRYRVIAYSLSNNVFANTEADDFITISTNGSNGAIIIENVMFATDKGEKHYFAGSYSQPTGLTEISNGLNPNRVYTIDGKAITTESLSKGMYIINGKKQLVK